MVDFVRLPCYNGFGVVACRAAAFSSWKLMQDQWKEVRDMLEYLLAIALILIALAVVMHEANKRN